MKSGVLALPAGSKKQAKASCRGFRRRSGRPSCHPQEPLLTGSARQGKQHNKRPHASTDPQRTPAPWLLRLRSSDLPWRSSPALGRSCVPATSSAWEGAQGSWQCVSSKGCGVTWGVQRAGSFGGCWGGGRSSEVHAMSTRHLLRLAGGVAGHACMQANRGGVCGGLLAWLVVVGVQLLDLGVLQQLVRPLPRGMAGCGGVRGQANNEGMRQGEGSAASAHTMRWRLWLPKGMRACGRRRQPPHACGRGTSDPHTCLSALSLFLTTSSKPACGWQSKGHRGQHSAGELGGAGCGCARRCQAGGGSGRRRRRQRPLLGDPTHRCWPAGALGSLHGSHGGQVKLGG